jgi:hypothetical protein
VCFSSVSDPTRFAACFALSTMLLSVPVAAAGSPPASATQMAGPRAQQDADARPMVGLAVSVSDTDVLANFGDGSPALRTASREAAQRIINQKLKGIEAIRWLATDPDKPIGDLTLVLHMDPQDGAVVLWFDAVRPSSSGVGDVHQTETLPEIHSWEMYDVNDNKRATDDQDGLRDAIVAHVKQHFDSSFEAAFSTAVLLMVPILRPNGPETITVLLTPNHFAFLLPIKWDALRPLPKTIFSMSFDAPPIPGARTLVPGTIYLAPSERFPTHDGALIASPIHECKSHQLGFHVDGHQRSQAECSTIDWINDPKVQALFTASVLKTATLRLVTYGRAVR